MDVDRVSEVGDRASEGQAAGVHGTDFTNSIAKPYNQAITY
jgi:hypothetical protein